MQNPKANPSEENIFSGGLFKPFPDATNYANCSKPTMYRLLAANKISYCRVGDDIRIPKAALDDYLRGNLVLAKK